MRDDLRGRSKYPQGTINTEVPQRALVKNPIFPPSYQPSKFQPNQEVVIPSTTACTETAGNCFVPEDTLLPCQNPSSNSIACARMTPSVEVAQPLQSRSINLKK